jgi:signal transduction histidine kinase
MTDPLVAVAAGALVVAVPAAFLVVWQRRRQQVAEADRRRLADEAEKGHETLAAAPDGLFRWDRTDGRHTCSRRLAVLLGLPAGTDSGFADVRACFSDEAAAELDQAVDVLRRDGIAFDLLLPVAGRVLQAVGVRAGTADGRPLVDLLWMRDVTETRGAGGALGGREREPGDGGGRLGTLLDLLPFPVWLRDAGLEISYANPAGTEDAVTEPARELALRALAEDRPLTERHTIAVDGTPRLFDVTEAPAPGGAGTAGFAILHGTGADTDPALDAIDRDQVFEHLGTAIAIFGANKQLVFHNPAYARFWNLDAAWLRSEPELGEVLERLREQRRLPEYADFRAFKEEQLGQFETLDERIESLLHLPDGTTLRAVVSPHSLGGLIFAYEDVTDRLDLERSFNTLTAVQGATLDNLYEGVAVFGSDGRLKLSNPVFARLWELDEDDLQAGLHVSDFVERTRPFIFGKDDWEGHKGRVIARLMSREPGSGRLLRLDAVVLDYANVPLPDGAVLLSYLDVTDSVRVELALRERAEAMEEANRLKSEFIANVSHEVRTPLNTIIGFAEVLTDQYFGQLTPRQMEYGQGILEASQNLMSIVSDILDLATIEAGMMALDLDTVDLHGMLVSVLSLVRERARRKSLKLEFDCPADIGWIVADEKRLKQVVFNLLSNAITFTPDQGAVHLEARRAETEIVISVTDTGVGIPQAEQERVFRTFERGTALEMHPGGAGLGLSLVARFVDLHGGRVDVKSVPNRGTTVTCHLPAGTTDEPE